MIVITEKKMFYVRLDNENVCNEIYPTLSYNIRLNVIKFSNSTMQIYILQFNFPVTLNFILHVAGKSS